MHWNQYNKYDMKAISFYTIVLCILLSFCFFLKVLVYYICRLLRLFLELQYCLFVFIVKPKSSLQNSVVKL